MPSKAWVLIPIALVLGGCGCNKPVPTPSTGFKKAPVDPWILTCVDPSVDAPALLWNGQIGVRLDRMATGIDESRPMLCIDEYEPSGEEKIRPLINPVGLDVSRNLNIDATRPYEQKLDMRTGLLTTHWETSGGGSVQVETMIHPTKREIAERWTLQMAPGELFSAATICGDRGTLPDSRDPRRGIWKLGPSEMQVFVRQESDAADEQWQFMRAGTKLSGASPPTGLVHIVRILRLQPSPNAAAMAEARHAASTPDRQPVSIPKQVDVADPRWESPDETKQELKGLPELSAEFDRIRAEAARIWAKRWQTDIEIDGPVTDQQAVRSFLFYLRSAIDPNGTMSISPFGLSNERYNGHVFWDADIWVFPALALIDPAAARAIPNYRLGCLGTSSRRFDQWLSEGRPTPNGSLGAPPQGTTMEGMRVAWESSVTGNETIPGPTKFEDHIDGDVPWMLNTSASLGLTSASDARRALHLASGFWRLRSIKEAGTLHIQDVVSVDERHIGEDDLYTNLLAQWCVNGGKWSPRPPAVPYYLPRDATSFLTYQGDRLTDYQQAAALLSLYPLQFPGAEHEAKAMIRRFADRTIDNGPAMSDSLHGLLLARSGDADQGYRVWRRSWGDFVIQPMLMFSEKRNRPITYFTTGAAGCLQTVLYGFLGFRIDSKQQDGAKWSTPLALGKILSVKPNLPKAWKSVKLKNFTVLGRRYTLVATHKGVNVTLGDR